MAVRRRLTFPSSPRSVGGPGRVFQASPALRRHRKYRAVWLIDCAIFPTPTHVEAHASSETATIDLQRYSYDPCAPPGRQARRGYAPLGRFAQSAEQCLNARKHGQAQPARFGAIFEALAGDFEYV